VAPPGGTLHVDLGPSSSPRSFPAAISREVRSDRALGQAESRRITEVSPPAFWAANTALARRDRYLEDWAGAHNDCSAGDPGA